MIVIEWTGRPAQRATANAATVARPSPRRLCRDERKIDPAPLVGDDEVDGEEAAPACASDGVACTCDCDAEPDVAAADSVAVSVANAEVSLASELVLGAAISFKLVSIDAPAPAVEVAAAAAADPPTTVVDPSGKWTVNGCGAIDSICAAVAEEAEAEAEVVAVALSAALVVAVEDGASAEPSMVKRGEMFCVEPIVTR